MLKLEDALKIANDYLKELADSDVESALDAQTHWIFYGKPSIGGVGVKVDKKTGTPDVFILPDEENFKLLDKAVKIALPTISSDRKIFLAE